MIKCIKCNELLKKTTLGSYYEFLFAMALAAECGRRGMSLDMSMMSLEDKPMLSKDDIDYMHYLKDIGSIYDGTDSFKYARDSKEDVVYNRPKLFFNVNAITDLADVLFKVEKDCYYWDTAYAYENYGNHVEDILNKKKLGNTIMHLMAYMFLSFKLGDMEEKPVKFYFKNYEVATMYLYLDLLACSKSLSVLSDLVNIDLDKNYADNIGDIDFNILYNIARHAGTLKKYSYDEKFDIFEKQGFKEGSIAILYERGRISSSNPVGTITRASVIRIDGMSKDLGSKTGWQVTKFSVNRTIEEKLDDYYGIDDSIKYLYKDMLNPTLGSSSAFLGFDTVGIGTYFYDEEYLIMPVENEGVVSKKVTIDGKSTVVEMGEIDMIYWILCQYGVDFDKDLYREFYNDGRPLKYDLCGSKK